MNNSKMISQMLKIERPVLTLGSILLFIISIYTEPFPIKIAAGVASVFFLAINLHEIKFYKPRPQSANVVMALSYLFIGVTFFLTAFPIEHFAELNLFGWVLLILGSIFILTNSVLLFFVLISSLLSRL